MGRLIARAAWMLLVLVVGASAIYVYLGRPDDQFASCRETRIAGGAEAIGGPFTLVDQTGATVTDAEVFTKPALLYFGYSFCPDVCPLDMARNAEAVDILEERGLEVIPVFVSVDPARDTPDVLAEFAANLHPRMVALTGSEEQIRAATQAYKTYFRIQEGDPEYYLVDHSTFTYLVLPQTGFVEFFKRDATADEIAESTACFIEAA
jgi:protein SCO1/2